MIEVKGVTKSFDDFTALDNVTCNIAEGCIYGMVGSNGAGKSTLLRVLSGIYKADKGEAIIDGINVYENTYMKNKLVFVADELFFLAGTNMKSMAKFYSSIYDNFDMDRFAELTKTFGLDPSKSISNFSKGMKRQAAIILALSTRAKYMFFDETFDGLDPVMRNLVKKLICGDVADNNATVIVTSHSLRELEDLCDHLSLLPWEITVASAAFKDDFDESKFEGIRITRYRQEGSVANMIVSGDREQTMDIINAMNPVVFDVLPLTLEEVFTYEMEALGYTFDVKGDKTYE